MAVNIFQKLEIEAFRAGITPRTKQSIEWFRKKAAALGKISRSNIFDEPEINSVLIGSPLDALSVPSIASPLFHLESSYSTSNH